MHKEIEIKIEINNNLLPKIEKWLGKNSVSAGTTNQTDYYLNNPQNSFFYTSDWRGKDTNKYLRIRKTNKKNFFCLKEIKRTEKGEPLYCNEREIEIDNPEEMLGLMKAIGFSDITILKKKREIFVYDIFEIAIDTVDKLGLFLEIELKEEVASYQAGYKLIYDLLRKMGITRFYKQPQGYVHKLWNPDLDLRREIIL